MSNLNDDWLDEEACPIALRKPAPPEVEDPVARIRLFDKNWKKLSQRQKTFLAEWQKNRFNARRTCRVLGWDSGANVRWNANEHFRLCKKVMQADVLPDVLDKARLVLRHDDCVEQLLEEHPILHQGMDTGFRENFPAAAAKANEVLLRLGGHLNDEQEAAPRVGPQLVVQLTNIVNGEVESETLIGVTPQLPVPEVCESEDDAWLSAP